MFSSPLHAAAAAADPFALRGMETSSYNYGNLYTQYNMSPYYRYMPQPVKQDMVCMWEDSETKKLCNKMFHTLHDIVNHLTVDHVGGPENSDHACYWQECSREKLQSQVQAGESCSCAHRRETVCLSLPNMWQTF